MEQNGHPCPLPERIFQTAEIFEKSVSPALDHKLTMYIVTDTWENCNRFPKINQKNIQNISFFAIIHDFSTQKRHFSDLGCKNLLFPLKSFQNLAFCSIFKISLPRFVLLIKNLFLLHGIYQKRLEKKRNIIYNNV